MKKGLWNSEQQKILNQREVDDKIFKNILNTAVEKIEQHSYCKKILEGAGYYKDERPDGFDPEHFYLEKIYIGHATPKISPQGHCTKESFVYRNWGEVPETPEISRDAVYISEPTAQSIVVDTLKLLAQNNNPTAQSLIKNNQIDTEKILDWQNAPQQYFSVKKQLEQALQNNPEFYNKFIDTTSGILVNLVTHECSHGNQMNNGLNNGIQTSKSLTPEDQQKETDYYFKIDENGKTGFQKWFEKQDLKSGYSTDCIDEAAVMASSYVAFLETSPSSEARTWINTIYNQRLINGHTMEQTLADFEKQNGVYQPHDAKLQQKLACCIFNRISSDYGQINLQKIKKHTNEENQQIDYNAEGIFKAIEYSYQENFFGSVEDYIQAIPGKIAPEKIAKLKICALRKRKDKINTSASNSGQQTPPVLKTADAPKKALNLSQYKNLKQTHEY